MQHLLHIRLPANLILNDSLPFLYAFQQTGIIFKQFIYHYQAIIYISRYCIIIKFQRLSISLFQHITSLFHSTGHTISSCYTLVCQYNAFIILQCLSFVQHIRSSVFKLFKTLIQY